MSIDQMRRNYTLGGLSESDVSPDPQNQFRIWLDQAGTSDLPDWFEVNAVTLATSDSSGDVSSRIVLLKGFDDDAGFHFFTNFDSEKGQQMAVNPRASMCVLWPHLQRQVRIRGHIVKLSREQSETYFASRPRASQLGAHASRQSTAVADRTELEQAMVHQVQKYEGSSVPCPENWGGYALRAVRVEFWQGRPSRLHDRVVYTKDQDGQWAITRLAP